jgi:hypothetical protein
LEDGRRVLGRKKNEYWDEENRRREEKRKNINKYM